MFLASELHSVLNKVYGSELHGNLEHFNRFCEQRGEPSTKLVGVADRGAERQNLHAGFEFAEEYKQLLYHATPLIVVHKLELIHHKQIQATKPFILSSQLEESALIRGQNNVALIL